MVIFGKWALTQPGMAKHMDRMLREGEEMGLVGFL